LCGQFTWPCCSIQLLSHQSCSSLCHHWLCLCQAECANWRPMPWLRQLVIGPSLQEPGLIPVQSMWCLWQTEWHWDRFFLY
jgi:hypothetical protein